MGRIFLAGSMGGYLTNLSLAPGASVLVRVVSQSGIRDDYALCVGSGQIRVETTMY